MKTLILNGSPRINGDIVSLLEELCPDLTGEQKLVNTYYCNVAPCYDCRYCWEHKGCVINDEMQEIYHYIEECDNIIIASPIYFSEITGKLLDFGSRLQTYFAARFFRKEIPVLKPKKGAVILVGGGDGNPQRAFETSCTLLHHMNCYDIHPPVVSHNTNNLPAKEDTPVLQHLTSVRDFLCGDTLKSVK